MYILFEVKLILVVVFLNVIKLMTNKDVTVQSDSIVYDKTSSVNEYQQNIAYSQSVPSSFSILVNFGIDGRQRTLYSLNNNEHDECDIGEIWDPFIKQCRQLYCSAHFTLVGFSCVETNNDTSDFKNSFLFLDSSSEYVNVTLKLVLEKPVKDPIGWIKSQPKQFKDEFTNKFSHYFANTLQTDRIANVTYVSTYTENKFDVNFNLVEGNVSDVDTVDNDKILTVMTSTINMGGMAFSLYNNTVSAYSIHSTLSEFKSFCNIHDWDMPIWYWNSEFTTIKENDVTYLYVNETGRKYMPGQYMYNILYVQSVGVAHQTTPNKVNVSSNAVVCETQTLINETCPTILLRKNEYEWTSDGNLLTRSGQIHDHFELVYNSNGSVMICFRPDIPHKNSNTIYDLIEDILSTVLTIISIVALMCVLVTYLRFQSLRSTIHGFMTINLSLGLQIMQIIFLANEYLQLIMNCGILAIFLHYLVLQTMSWTSVIAYDMYRTFGTNKVSIRDKNSIKIRLRYWIIANTAPVIIITMSIICNNFKFILSPNYGLLFRSSICWIRNSWAAFLFFGFPLCIQIIINICLYLITICSVRKDLNVSRSMIRVTRYPSDSSESSNGSIATTSTTSLTSTTMRPNQLAIFTRLGVLMGFTWIIALVIAIIPQEYDILLKALSYLFVICNTSQGLTLFIAFICNAKVLRMWRKQT